MLLCHTIVSRISKSEIVLDCFKNQIFSFICIPIYILDSSSYHIPDSQSFLFMAKISGNEQMVKITPIPGAYGGIWCFANTGPSFGSKSDCDLEVLHAEWLGPDTLACKCNLGYGFTCLIKDEYSNLIDMPLFKIEELEVFHIEY